MSIPRLEADFNEVFDSEYIWVSVRRTADPAAQRVEPGNWVSLFDEDGLACWAVVTDRTGPIVTCHIDATSWRSAKFTKPLVYWGEYFTSSKEAPSFVPEPRSTLGKIRAHA